MCLEEPERDVRFENRLPTPEEHQRLAESVGWGAAFHWPSLSRSLDNSWCGVVALAGDDVVAMGRLVGDGAMYYYIQDVAVLPSYQGQGIGQRIVDELLAYVQERAPAFVGLFATGDAIRLYERKGFDRGDLTGMFQVIRQPGEGQR